MEISTDQMQIRQDLSVMLDSHSAVALEGGNFSGRTDLLRWMTNSDTPGGNASIAVSDGKLMVYVGPEIYNSISGLASTVREELRLHAGCCSEQSSVAALIQETGLDGLYDRNPFTLSGGEQALLALLSALALNPALVAVDCSLEQIDSIFKTRLLNQMICGDSNHTRAALADNSFYEIDGAANLPTIAIKCSPIACSPYMQFDPLTADIDLSGFEASSFQLSLSEINFRYPRGPLILKDASVQLHPGKLYSLEGPNGAGKSTLAKLLSGVLLPNSGKILANEEQIHPWKHPGRSVAYHFQNPDVQLFSTTVEEEVRAGLQASGLNGIKCEQRVDAVLMAFGLSHIRKEHPLDTPFVIRKRIALAATIAMGRPWLVLDEPTLGQDSYSAEEGVLHF